MLEQSLEMADAIGQRDAIIVMDQAEYAKAVEIVWKQKERFNRVILRLGILQILLIPKMSQKLKLTGMLIQLASKSQSLVERNSSLPAMW